MSANICQNCGLQEALADNLLCQNCSEKKHKYSRVFILIMLIGILGLGYLFLKPFLNEIVMATVLVTIFYPFYLKISVYLKGKQTLAEIGRAHV